MSYATTNVTVKAEDGTEFSLTVPVNVPSNDRAAYLKSLWDLFVVELDGHWKGAVKAHVPNKLANDVAEAMEFYGAIVDLRSSTLKGYTTLGSKGYTAHGF